MSKPKKEDLSLDKLKKLCNKSGNIYISKKGLSYIKSLKTIVNINNKNDLPFTNNDVEKQPLKKDFKFKGIKEYNYICSLEVRPMSIDSNKRTNEKLIACNFKDSNAEKIYKNSLGVSYLLTMETSKGEHIIKIGQTRKTFKERLSSYNCGCMHNWRTASTTNIKILQSAVVTRKNINVYICDCSDEPYQLIWYGKLSPHFASPKSLAVENIMLTEFYNQFNQKPLANVQTELKNAKVIDIEDD